MTFQRILIANRGEVAARIQRTCERLGVETAVVFSEADAGLEYVERAQHRYSLGGGGVRDTYLAVDKLLAAIEQTGADAVHPGYGLLSESPAFAEAVSKTTAAFIGPSPALLSKFGDKVSARKAAAEVGVSSPPGTEEPVTLGSAATEAAGVIGFPLLVKAAAGGGGIGMTVVESADQLDDALTKSAGRGKAAFGDDRVYLEKYLSAPRHIEVQVVADAFGKVAILGERECSVQRRYQKVIEEGPCPASKMTESARAGLYDAARRVIEGSGYVGLATIEFVADGSGAELEFFFLEVNARLQVEHPVTEMLTGLDLVELQLIVAAGQPLPMEVADAASMGHAFEVRLYAEDPSRRFLPQPGVLETLQWPSAQPWLRVETGFRQGEKITPLYDPLIAKVVVHGKDRPQALERLARSLAETRLLLMGPKGQRASNLQFLRDLIKVPELRSGDYDTGLVSRLLGKQS